MSDRAAGQRFSLIYLPQGDPANDSKTMRYRLAKLIGKDKYQPQRHKASLGRRDYVYVADYSQIQDRVEEELGCQFCTVVDGSPHPSWVKFLERIPIEKVLDTITIAYNRMAEAGRQGDFIDQVNRIFREENTAYEVDQEGGVHPSIDGAYAGAKQAAIRGMNEARYALSLARINEVDAALMSSPPDYIKAIRAVFGANENLFKLMCGAARLDARSASDKLMRKLQAIYVDHPTMQRSSAQILKSFGSWIDAAHHYRHEEGSEEPSQPDEDLAIALISEGMSFIRWLVGIDKRSHAK
nr:hypothetical protein [uncultured Cohaesibacter sp.]